MDSPPVPAGTPAGTRNTLLPSGVSPLEPEDPAVIGRYSLAGRLGAGGMGRVYLGRDRDGGLAAVKVAHASVTGSPEEVRARFRAEADCLSRVPGACTARLLADGAEGTPPFIVTEYLAGRSLKNIVENDGPLPPATLRVLATGTVRALAVIHRAGLIHRDVKPANVLLTPAGPRVIDFGIAQPVSGSGGVTGTGMLVGSVGWIAPERLTHRPTTPASDVFCWGCLVAYAATARNPFGAGDAEDVARRAILEPPDLDGLDPSLRPLVEAALAKEPADRPAAEDLLVRLGATDPLPEVDTEADQDADPLTPWTDTAPAWDVRPRRRSLPLAVAASVVVALAAAGASWATGVAGPNPPHSGQGTTVQQKPPGDAADTADTAVISRRPAPPASNSVRTQVAVPSQPAIGHEHTPKKPNGKRPGHGGKGH